MGSQPQCNQWALGAGHLSCALWGLMEGVLEVFLGSGGNVNFKSFH